MMSFEKRFQRQAAAKEKPKANPQTTKSGGGIKDRCYAYLRLHAHALFSSLGRLLQTPFTSILTVMVLAIAIASACSFYVLVSNVAQLAANLEVNNQISLFLKQNITDSQGEVLAKTLEKNPRIKSITLITKANALTEFKNFSGFGNALDVLDGNPLPTVIQVLPKNSLTDSDDVQQLVNEFSVLPEVELAQMDMQWVRRLRSMIELAQSGVWVSTSILSFAVLFIMGNTIRLELEGRRDEVLIAKLVGATYSFIRRPFLYTGFWLGFAAGMIAWMIVTLMMLILKQPLEKLLALYEGDYHVLFLSFTDSLLVLGISAVLGIIGAWIALHYQLAQMKPE